MLFVGLKPDLNPTNLTLIYGRIFQNNVGIESRSDRITKLVEERSPSYCSILEPVQLTYTSECKFPSR